MSKVTVENRRGKITIINRLSYPEAVNERVYNAVASGMFEGFLPVYIRQKGKETRLECVVQGYIPLTQYFSGIVTKKMFLDFAHELALLIKSCDKHMINANNLDLQSDRIFVDPQTKRVKCIFWPIVNNQRENPPHMFLRQLPFGLNFNPYEDRDYLEAYKAFFGGVNPFAVNSFDRLVLKLAGKKGPDGYTTPSEALSGALGGDAKSKQRDIDLKKKVNIEYDPFADDADPVDVQEEVRPSEPEITPQTNEVICASCGKKNPQGAKFCGACGTKIEICSAEIAVEEPEDETPPSGNGFETMVLGDDTGGTTVLGYDEEEEPVYPTLVRLRTEEAYSVNKPSFRIGTEQSYCDLFICDNNYISRSHADIITRDNRYYIVDHNSTNKTFVDGKVIPAEKEIEIFEGTQIRLANEDFTFSTES